MTTFTTQIVHVSLLSPRGHRQEVSVASVPHGSRSVAHKRSMGDPVDQCVDPSDWSLIHVEARRTAEVYVETNALGKTLTCQLDT